MVRAPPFIGLPPKPLNGEQLASGVTASRRRTSNYNRARPRRFLRIAPHVPIAVKLAGAAKAALQEPAGRTSSHWNEHRCPVS